MRECYEALGVVHANWKPVPGRFKDYIALPKVNMYQSLHTTVIGPRGQRMEVQIRTARDASRWPRKESRRIGATRRARRREQRDTERFAWLRRLIEWQQNLKDPQEFLSTVKDDLFPEEVFVFTPKGDVLDFPQGATRDRFRLSHPFAGRKPSGGARINGRMVPLRYRLNSGDTVEVITTEQQTPGQGLGEFRRHRARQKPHPPVVARTASGALARAGHLAARSRARAAGTDASTQLRHDKRLEAALKEFSQRDVDSLLAAVGYGIITAAPVAGKAADAR